MQTAVELPQLTFQQCMWDTLVDEGWEINQFSFQNGTSGSSYLVRAKRKGAELICSAPSLSLAVQVIYNQRMAADEAA